MSLAFGRFVRSGILCSVQCFCVAVLTACDGGSSSSSTPPDFSPAKAALDPYVSKDASPSSGSVSGYSFAAVSRDGTLYLTAGGNQTVSTVSPIASATKLPSAIAILALVDAGKLDLDKKVGDYFAVLDPTFPWPTDKQAITTRMLLSHTAGIPSPPYPSTSDCLSSALQTLRECAAEIATTALDYPPGTTFSYSGADYQVAGYLAELLTGLKWQDWFAKAVAQPLGLAKFSYGVDDNPRIAGGASSDVSDYSKILLMLLNGGLSSSGTRVLSQAMLQQLRTDQIAGLAKGFVPFDTANAPSYPGYTLSLWISASSLYQPLGSPGPEYSDPGLFGTTPWLDFGLGYAAVILITQDTATGLAMWNSARPSLITAMKK